MPDGDPVGAGEPDEGPRRDAPQGSFWKKRRPGSDVRAPPNAPALAPKCSVLAFSDVLPTSTKSRPASLWMLAPPRNPSCVRMFLLGYFLRFFVTSDSSA